MTTCASDKTEQLNEAGWPVIRPGEAAIYLVLPFDVRLVHYITHHKKQQCPKCKFLIGQHTLSYFKFCAAAELPQFQLSQLEALIKEANGEPTQS